jgi:hypothetical protein
MSCVDWLKMYYYKGSNWQNLADASALVLRNNSQRGYGLRRGGVNLDYRRRRWPSGMSLPLLQARLFRHRCSFSILNTADTYFYFEYELMNFNV